MAKKSKSQSPFEGRWRITSMEMWGQDFVDAEVEGYFEFDPNGQGSEWTWDGNDEMDPAQGRGWAVIEGNEIHGHNYRWLLAHAECAEDRPPGSSE